MERFLRTKIVATIGPASRALAVLEAMIEAGMCVARLNFSHGTHAEHAETIRRIREASAKLGRPVAILADLQGPKLRVGEIPEGGIPVREGEIVTLTAGPARVNGKVIPVQFDGLPQAVEPGDRILIDDGTIELEVVGRSEHEVQARVVVGGVIRSHKGLNLPHIPLSISAITEKDREDLAFALEQGVDWVALSFVRTADEVYELKALIRRYSRPDHWVPVVAKIEKPQALDHLEEIIEAADGVMVARGDLAVETSPEEVPLIQKRIIRLCNEAGKPVITATQMLESMVHSPRPTRAEVSDVANAILDGSDAVMLSAETASGKYPVESVRMMARIIARVEAEMLGSLPRLDARKVHRDVAQAVAHAAVLTAHELEARLIITPTLSGNTARQVSRFRPRQPIIAPTPNERVQRRLLLYWGVFPFLAPRHKTTDDMLAHAVDFVVEQGFAQEHDVLVLVAGAAGSPPGSTDFMKVEVVRRVLARGKGIGTQSVRGRVVRVAPPVDTRLQLPEDAIAVVRHLDLATASVLEAARGIVVEQPLDPVQTEYIRRLGIPAVVGVGDTHGILADAAVVVLDARRGVVYEG